MSRKLGALMLSFLLVMLSAIGAFAVTVDDLSVEEDSDYASYTLTEGYNYRTRIFADINADYVPDKVSWEVYPADPSDNFLTWRLVSNDTMIVLEGVLPAYSETSNDHVYHVIAHISGDVASKDANGDDVYDPDTNDQVFISGDISMDVGYGDGLTITPDEDYTLVGLFPEMLTISYDSSVVESRDVVRDEYSVSIIFLTSADQVPVYERDSDGEIVYDEETYDPITTGALKDGNIYVLLQIDASDLEYLKEYINLPSWLAYEVVSSQDSYQYDEYSDETTPDGYNYIKELRIFYSSDHEPQDGAKGTIRITGGMFDYNYTGYVDPDGTDPTWQSDPTIGWSVAYSAVPPVTLESTDIEVSPDCDVSVDLTIGYTKQEPVSIEFTPDISAHVKLSADWTTTVFEEENMVGTIALHVEPITIADATYSTDMVVTDANGKTATAHITVNVVVPSIVVEPATVEIISAYGGSADKAVTWSRVKPIGYTYSPDIDEGFGLSVESDDSTITIAIAPTISDDWTGTLTILDAYGKSADISLYLQSVVSGEITIEAEVSGDAGTTTFTAGEPFTVTLNAGNTYGAVTWNLVNQEYLEDYRFTITQLSDTVYTFTMPEWTSGTYSADFRATDESGRDAGQYVFTFTVNHPPLVLSGDFGTISLTYPSSGDASIDYTKALPVDWTISPDISADVSIDIAVIPANSLDIMGKIILTATPKTIADETYETAIYFTDENGNTDSADLTVNVTVPAISITPTSATLAAYIGESDSVKFTYTGPAPIGWATDASTLDFTLNVTSDDSAITVTATPINPVTASATLTILDAYGKSADIALTLEGLMSGDISVDVVVSGDGKATVTTGDTLTVKLNAGNVYGTVTWSVANLAYLEDLDFTLTPLANGYMITAPEGLSAGTYSADFSAVDESGRDAGHYVFNFNVVLPIMISGDFAVSLTYPSSADASVKYYNAPAISWAMSPDISADVSIDVVFGEGDSGDIELVVTPITIADGEYSTTLYFTDENGNTDSADLTVAVTVPSITITPTSATLEAYTGESDSAKFTYTGPAPIGWATDASTLDFTLNVTSDDSAITVTATPINPVTASATLTILDAYGKSADIALTLKGNQSGNIGVTASGNVSEAEIVTGNSSSVTLTAGNTYGTISWSIANLSYLQGLGFTVSPTSTTGSTATFTFTAPDSVSGTYSADITAKDETGRTAGHYTFTMNVVLPQMVISGDFGTINVVYGSSADATVEYYDADPASWTFDPDISADVSIDVVFVSADSDVVEGTITVTATLLTALADTYSTVIYFTDANGYVTSADLNIAVTLPKIAVTPSSITVDAASTTTGWTGAGTLAYTGTAPVKWTASPEVPSGFRFTVTSADGSITLAINPELSFILSDYPATTKRYDGTLTFTDAYGGTANVTLRLQASDPSLFTISGTAPTMTITAGESATMNFTARNNRNNAVTWSVSPTSSNGVTASISPASSGSTSATLTVRAAESATAGSVKLTVLAEANLGAGLSLPASYDVAVTVRAKPISDDKPESEDKPAQNDNTVSNKPISEDSGLTSLVSNGYIKSNGAISDNAFANGSDKPTSSFRTSGNTYSKRLVMAFAVRVWYIYLGGTQYGPFSASTVGATIDSPVTITPDANDPTAATVEIDRTQLTSTTQEVDLGVIPTSSTNDTIVKSNIGTVSSTTSSGGTGENITNNNNNSNGNGNGNGNGNNGNTTLGASGGGCASGFGAAVMALAAAFIIRKKR